jgi:hypothetical protein
MTQPPYKGPIRHLHKYIHENDREHTLNKMATSFPNIRKWTNDPNIDNTLSTSFWNQPEITDYQITCLLKFRLNQYMGNAHKQLFFGTDLYPSITCSIHNSLEPDTWFHVLLTCKQQHIHALRTTRHNKAVVELRKLIISSSNSRCYILMNASTFNANPLENIVPPWLLPYTCQHQRCQCNARFKPDILCIRGIPYQHNPLLHPSPNIII